MFKIEITEIVDAQMTDRSWVPLTKDGDHTEYGYAPEIIKPTTKSIERLRQTVETLNMPAVIRAVNDLELPPMPNEFRESLNATARRAAAYDVLVDTLKVLDSMGGLGANAHALIQTGLKNAGAA